VHTLIYDHLSLDYASAAVGNNCPRPGVDWTSPVDPTPTADEKNNERGKCRGQHRRRDRRRVRGAGPQPILDELNAEHGDKLTFLKMNVDENPVTPSSYRVTGIPTINVYQGGEVVKSIVGAKPKAALLRELEGII
jgi:thiol-disulfide isomerase/thioredoxin